MAKRTTPTITPLFSWLRGTLREFGATSYQVEKLASATGIAKYLKREPGGRYGFIGTSFTMSDYTARALRKETFPAIERAVSNEAARTGRSLKEVIKDVVPVRQRRVAVERELTSEREIKLPTGQVYTRKVHPHTGREPHKVIGVGLIFVSRHAREQDCPRIGKPSPAGHQT